MEVRLRPAAAESSDPGSPAAVLEIPDAFPSDDDPFGLEQGPLEPRGSAISSEASGSRNHPVARNISLLAIAHDVANGSRGARPAGELGDVAVGRDFPDRDSTHSGEDFGFEVGHAFIDDNCQPPTPNSQLPRRVDRTTG
jgi:hypothetical protein